MSIDILQGCCAIQREWTYTCHAIREYQYVGRFEHICAKGISQDVSSRCFHVDFLYCDDSLASEPNEIMNV